MEAVSYASHFKSEKAISGSLLSATVNRSGSHQLSTFAELRLLFATNAHRRDLWFKLICFLSWPILTGRFSMIYIDGGFISPKEYPHDVDIILETKEPYGPAAFKVLEPFFAIGLETIMDSFTVHLHFWMQGAPPGIVDFREFFLQKRREQLPSAPASAQGGFCVSLKAPNIRDLLREEIEAATYSPRHRKFRSS